MEEERVAGSSHWWWALASSAQVAAGIASYRRGKHGDSKFMPLKAFLVASLILGAGATGVAGFLSASGIHSVQDLKDLGADIRACLGKPPRETSKEGMNKEVGNGAWDSWFIPMKKQAEIVFDKVKKTKELSKGWAFTGPHTGTAFVPLCGKGIMCIIANNLIKSEIYSNYVQDFNGIADSFGSKWLYEASNTYLKGCSFLPKLNNEIPNKRNSTYKGRLTSLQNLVLIMFEQDKVLIPKETSWFGYYPDGTFDTILPPQETKLYKEDWIGLKTWDEAGNVKYINVSGGHLGMSQSDMRTYVLPYLEDQPPKNTIGGSFSSLIWTTIGGLMGFGEDEPLLHK